MRKICLVLCSTASNQFTSSEEHFKRLMSVDLFWLPKTTRNSSSAAHTVLLKQWPHAPVGIRRSWVPDFLQILKNGSCFTNESLKKLAFSGLPHQMPSSQLSGEIVPLPCLEGPADIVRHESRNLPPHGPLGDSDEAGIGVISVLSKGNETAMPPLNQWKKTKNKFQRGMISRKLQDFRSLLLFLLVPPKWRFSMLYSYTSPRVAAVLPVVVAERAPPYYWKELVATGHKINRINNRKGRNFPKQTWEMFTLYSLWKRGRIHKCVVSEFVNQQFLLLLLGCLST